MKPENFLVKTFATPKTYNAKNAVCTKPWIYSCTKDQVAQWYDANEMVHTDGYGCVLSMCFLFFQRYLPREVDPLVYNMSHEDPGSVSYSEIGGLSEQIRELREVQLIRNKSYKTTIGSD